MQWSEIGELAQLRLDFLVDEHRVAKPLAAVHDAMPYRERLLGKIVQRLDRLARVVFADERELQAGRACIDDENARTAQ